MDLIRKWIAFSAGFAFCALFGGYVGGFIFGFKASISPLEPLLASIPLSCSSIACSMLERKQGA